MGVYIANNGAKVYLSWGDTLRLSALVYFSMRPKNVDAYNMQEWIQYYNPLWC